MRGTALLRSLVVAGLCLAAPACQQPGAASARTADATPANYGFEVVRSFPHDRNAFTQGLLYLDGVFYESTGLNGRSSLRKVDPETGKVLQISAVEPQYFAEGLTNWKDELIQLTWQSQLGFVYDRATFAREKTFEYPGEGWGITQDGKRLIVSDGTPVIRFFDPDTLKETARITVRDRGREVKDLNELEYVKGEIYANIWLTNLIARISPETGEVVGWINLQGILGPTDAVPPEAVLNGIAYDEAADRLFVTGKLWPRIFQITLVKR